jgi:23S rRNA pseudouridine1911/1915/1917 synthase
MKHTKTNPNIPIVYEDDHLLVIDKPVNVLSQEDHTGDADVLTLCKQYLKSTSKSGAPYMGLVHRLDRPVGGLMLLAKTNHAAKALSQQVRDRTMQKSYWAVTSGNPPENGVLTHHLLKDRENNIVQVVSGEQKKAKQAILSFTKLERAGDLNLLSIHLQTGRPHQIRVQLAAEGYPVWGDYKYGSDQPDGRNIALRAVELVFDHPRTQKEIHLTLHSPDEFPWNRFNHKSPGTR